MNAPHSALILAAGASGRMGRDKAALPWLGGMTLLEWTAAALQRAGWQPIVVLGPHNHPAWRDRLPDATLVLNPDASTGKTTSLAAGARALPSDAAHFLVTSVDQPRPAVLYRTMREAAISRPESVLVPDRNGRRGHPVVLSAGLRSRLTTLAETALGLRGLLDELTESTHRVPCDADWLRWDCNTPEAYRTAREWFEARGEIF